jgi:hypothetical protein
LLDELERLRSVLDIVPSTLDVETYLPMERLNTHGLTCANELLKFFVDDETAIPDRLLTPERLADKRRRPDQYTRAYITEMQKAFLAMDAAFKADAPRFSIEYRKLHPAPVGELSRDTLLAHEKWWRGGRVGPPPLTLKHQKFQKLRDLGFEGCDLEDIVFDHCFAACVQFVAASLKQVTFLKCNLQGTSITDAKIENTVVEDSWLTRCMFTPGTHMGAPQKYLHAGQTNGAVFEDCDLRGVKLDGRDLSGATFIRCKLAGATGAPRASEGLVLQDCDLSRDEFLAALTAR